VFKIGGKAMAGKEKGSAIAFAALVTRKLKERGMNQAELGRRIHKGRAYMSYLVHGTNRGARGGKFMPSSEVIRWVAKELDIPVDEAFRTAGLEVSPADRPPPAAQPARADPVRGVGKATPAPQPSDEPPANKTATDDRQPAKAKKKEAAKENRKGKKKEKKKSTRSLSDERLFDIVYQASLEALRTGGAPAPGTRSVTIELAGNIRLALSGLDESTRDETIENYKSALVAAYKSVSS
jgi:transcriptional regulator with XRE-family HTH domain